MARPSRTNVFVGLCVILGGNELWEGLTGLAWWLHKFRGTWQPLLLLLILLCVFPAPLKEIRVTHWHPSPTCVTVVVYYCSKARIGCHDEGVVTCVALTP
jgi:hypothetical protein